MQDVEIVQGAVLIWKGSVEKVGAIEVVNSRRGSMLYGKEEGRELVFEEEII